MQGWVLEPLHGGPHPATKVVFVVQENMKGWVPGFAKKTLARRPLVIAKVAEYLERKTERVRSQQQNKSGLLQSINSGHSRRPSVMSIQLQSLSPSQQQLGHFNSKNRLLQPQPQQKPSILGSLTPPLPSVSNKKHISFAEHDITYTTNQPPQDTSTPVLDNSSYHHHPKNVLTSSAKTNPRGGHLYPSHRHPIQKVESIQLLKKLTFSLDNWNLTKELEDGSKHYTFNSHIFSDEEEDDDEDNDQALVQKNKNKSARKVPFLRADGLIQGGWTAEQLCSVIHCFGSRKICK